MSLLPQSILKEDKRQRKINTKIGRSNTIKKDVGLQIYRFKCILILFLFRPLCPSFLEQLKDIAGILGVSWLHWEL